MNSVRPATEAEVKEGFRAWVVIDSRHGLMGSFHTEEKAMVYKRERDFDEEKAARKKK